MTTPRADEDKIRQSILDMVGCAGSKYTPMDLEREICARQNISRKAVRRAVNALMAENRLTYTQFLGHTFVEISYKRAVETGGGVILAPPDAVVTPPAGTDCGAHRGRCGIRCRRSPHHAHGLKTCGLDIS
jgi:hypothetical protein